MARAEAGRQRRACRLAALAGRGRASRPPAGRAAHRILTGPGLGHRDGPAAVGRLGAGSLPARVPLERALPLPTMPATPFYCNWCRERVGVYHSGDAPFTPDGAPPHAQSDHLRAGVVAEADDGPIVAYPCPACGRSNLLQLPARTEA